MLEVGYLQAVFKNRLSKFKWSKLQCDNFRMSKPKMATVSVHDLLELQNLHLLWQDFREVYQAILHHSSDAAAIEF